MKNKYIKVTHVSVRKTREIIRLFCLDIEAKKTAELVGVSRQTINRFYRTFRERTAELCEAHRPFANGEIELDESYFGAHRVRGIRGRGAKGKTALFGMLRRGEKVYTQSVKRVAVAELMPIIQGKADPGAVIYTDGFKTYNGLVNYMGTKSFIESNTVPMKLLMELIISTESKTFGDFVKSDFPKSVEFTNTPSICISMSANLD